MLGVLHEPGTRLDGWLADDYFAFASNGYEPFMRPLVREAMVAPWGARIFIVAPPIDGGLAVVPHVKTEKRSQWRRELAAQKPAGVAFTGEVVALPSLSSPQTVKYSSVLTASSIREGDVVYTQASDSSDPFAPPEFSHREDVAVVVPNGVTRVEFVLPRQPIPIYGAPIYRHVRYVTAKVHNNVAAAILNQPCCYVAGGMREQFLLEVRGVRSFPPAMVWFNGAGRVVKRIGDLRAANRVVRVPVPAPPTASSRAAERNPATPNRVWVTPRSGSQGSAFHIHFHVLLNGAEYYYLLVREGKPLSTRATETCLSAPQLSSLQASQQAAQGGVPAGLHLNDVRGTVWDDVLAYVQDSYPPVPLCPGRYRISVGLANHGFSDPRTYRVAIAVPPPAKPFGTAVFIVRRASSTGRFVVLAVLVVALASIVGIVYLIRRTRRSIRV